MKTFSAAIALATLFVSPAFAQQERFSRPPALPIVPEHRVSDLYCWVETARVNVVDLAALCGQTQAVFPAASYAPAGDFTPSGGGVVGGSAGDDGVCNFAWQRDSAGRRCGGRAASERSGGR